MIRQLAIIGVGLIGGSLARALREAEAVEEVVGFSRRVDHLQEAVDLGVIDRAAISVEDAVRSADMIVLAVPVGNVAAIMQQIAEHASVDAIVTDVGSVKGSVIEAARQSLGDSFDRFVPGHPIAGTEHSGVAASFAELFQGHRVVLTPEEDTDEAAVDKVWAMWREAGADVIVMDAVTHDAVLAACSHVPHVLAFTLVDTLVRQDNHKAVFDLAAGGFRDFTRIAGSDPVMWRDICLHNARAVNEVLRLFRDDLDAAIKAIESRDGEFLLETFQRARHARQRFITHKSRNDKE